MPHAVLNSEALGTLAQARAFDLLQADGLNHAVVSEWTAYEADPAKADLPLLLSEIHRYRSEYVFAIEGGIAYVRHQRPSTIFAAAHGETPEAARAVAAAVRDAFPERENPAQAQVPITFWTYSAHGPRSIKRDLDAPRWDEIVPNYAAASLGHLGKLFAPDFRPGHGGQFLLWHGEPGTGKTTALRALAREWRDWCGFHYIADPELFFGERADYMLDVLIEEEYHEDGEQNADRWRVLILEDTGELLHADARAHVGQGLSRFLNCVDGMIGQGLRVLVLVTTNEPLGKLHPAVTRPGRSALTVEFEPLAPAEATDWLAAHGIDHGASERRILADLYAELESSETRSSAARVGFG